MKHDGIVLAEGSYIKNVSIDKGAEFPDLPNVGELFYIDDSAENNPIGLYVFNTDLEWIRILQTGDGGGTDLSVSHTSTQVTVLSSTGADAILLSASSTEAGIFTAANFNKLAGIADNATANQTDTYLLDRANHTGTQAQSTITGLTAALDSKQASLVSTSNIKSINGVSILGSGDLEVETSPFDSTTDAYINKIRKLALGAM